jgi:hypothetical protein
MLELRYTPADVVALREQPAIRDAVHWGLLVARIGPIVGKGRPELPVHRSTEAQKQHDKADIIRSQAAYDHLVELIHVPADVDEAEA